MNIDKDTAQAALAELTIKPGDRYWHYKGGEYEVVALAVKEDTLEPLVIYRSLEKGYVWARTVKDWSEEVEMRGKRVRRFERLSQ
jgi:hypothetical protein